MLGLSATTPSNLARSDERVPLGRIQLNSLRRSLGANLARYCFSCGPGASQISIRSVTAHFGLEPAALGMLQR